MSDATATQSQDQDFEAALKKVLRLFKGWYRSFQPDGTTLSDWGELLNGRDPSLFVPAAHTWTEVNRKWPPEAPEFAKLVEDLEGERRRNLDRIANARLVELSKARSLRNYHPAGSTEYTDPDSQPLVRYKNLDISEQRLFQAIVDNELVLVYQPIVEMSSRRVQGAEALIRWNHPTAGIVPPDVFLPSLEQNGLICLVDGFALSQTYRQASEWLNSNVIGDDFTLHVNASAVTLETDTLADNLALILERRSLSPENLVIELTETARTRLARSLPDSLEKISKLGVRIALDDFGTGLSSLSRLAQLPVGLLKIDKSFTSELGNMKGDNIVASIVALARQFDLRVIAEGVESEDQAARLVQLGCPLGQGFHFGKPMSADEFRNWLKN